MIRAELYGGPADGYIGPVLQVVTVIAVPYHDGSILYYEPSWTDGGKLATNDAGHAIFRYKGLDQPPEVANVP